MTAAIGSHGAFPQSSAQAQSLALARTYLRQRGIRRAAFGADVFREPAWDIMLDLFCARLAGKEVSIMDACIAADVPSTTALRYLRRLIALKLVVRRRDGRDRRRSWVALSDRATRQVEGWLRDTWPSDYEERPSRSGRRRDRFADPGETSTSRRLVDDLGMLE